MIKIAIAQINCTVGDLEGNCKKILEYYKQAYDKNADIVCFPELAVTGYPPEDLLYYSHFVDDNIKTLNKIIDNITGTIAIIGFVDKDEQGNLYNAAAIIQNKKLIGKCYKHLLPNYSVFDEKRYFKSGTVPFLFNVKDNIIGINICEDIWHEHGPLKMQSDADIIINISSSPFHYRKYEEREKVLVEQAKKNDVYIFYCNMIGGQDELVFDGQSMVYDNKGKLIARASEFKEELLIENIITPRLDFIESIYKALVIGVRDYIQKNNFKKAVIGISGGIDSALVAAIACDAIGKENVLGISMPSLYSSKETQKDAKILAKNLGIELKIIPINNIYKKFLKTLKPFFENKPFNSAEENIQARIRGTILMGFSNKFGHIVLTTGNKSETAVGYCTLYGDMAGGFAVIKDVPKTMVYKLCDFYNKDKNIIPESIIKRAPSAELKHNQKDSDLLPEYDLLDPILAADIEEHKSLDEIVKISSLDKNTIKRIQRLVYFNEYKRRQAPPGIKISPKAFGKDRRMPITNKY